MPNIPHGRRQWVAMANGSAGFWIVSVGQPGQARKEVYDKALTLLHSQYNVGDTDAETAQRLNLTTVTLAQVKRAFPIAWRHWEFQAAQGRPPQQ